MYTGPRAERLEYPGKELSLFLWIVGQCPKETLEGPSGGSGEQVGGGKVGREAGQEAIRVGQRGQEHLDCSGEGGIQVESRSKKKRLCGGGEDSVSAVGAHHRA